MAVTDATSDPRPVDQEKGPQGANEIHTDTHAHSISDSDDDAGTRKQKGVEAVQAVTHVWTRKMMWLTFVLLWFLCFAANLLSSIEGALSPYITSYFEEHGLLAAISVTSRIVSGVFALAVGKYINLRGRMEGFIFGISLIIMGMIMKAACQNIETYGAAQVFYWVGHVNTLYIVDVFVADITTLRNRMLIFSLNSFSSLITTFAGPPIASAFYNELNFRWAFIVFVIVLVVFALPVIAILWLNERKAKKAGILRAKSGRTVAESAKYYAIKFDIPGMLLLCGGWSMMLLPFSLVDTIAAGDWANSTIIGLIVGGAATLAVFGVWERFAPVQFFPFKLMQDRTVVGALCVYLIIFLSTFIWDAYYSSYLQVVHGLDIITANYVLNAYSLTSYVMSPLIALVVRYTGEVKWTGMAGVPIYILGTGLLVYFRTPDSYVGYLAMCQILVGFSTGVLVLTSQLALMYSISQADVAIGLALYSLFGSIGSSAGFAVAGGMWTNILPYKIAEFLPESAKDQAATIYGSIEVQLSEPIGSPIRDAVIAAYGDVMHKMVIAGVCLIPLLVAAVIIWRGKNVKEVQEKERAQRGNIF
ncbi:major facilitator superfamily transporter [Microdochium trichocladiopsis]|uniref:Major facilitator superfamily transporter n=1 Tax=Microdochium trichocladiopsis TaxID=1682393 RepID=A0A9P8Y7Q0_9PEZI|nr:major facilitator superfamily transporter [Microdochium trichocladiopsis]KAH7031452.1 major facilitator superfamily transporter [Microdochium trichocladiopsis]